MQLSQKKYGDASKSIVVLHGLLGAANNWASVAQELGKQYSVTVPSLRNHGDSPHGPHTTTAMVSDIVELLDKNELDKPIFLGHSMGGMVAMLFAMLYPGRVADLIVVDISPVHSMSGLLPIFGALAAVDLSRVRQKKDAEAQLFKTIGSSTVRQFLLQNLKRQDEGIYSWRCNLPELQKYVQTERFSLGKDDVYLGDCLFIAGGKSEHRITEHLETIGRHFPNHQLEVIEEAGHWLHFEAREKFLAVVRGYLGRSSNPT